jgi:hypothetical protein
MDEFVMEHLDARMSRESRWLMHVELLAGMPPMDSNSNFSLYLFDHFDSALSGSM